MISGDPLSAVPLSAVSEVLAAVDETLAWLPRLPTLIIQRQLYALPARSFYVSPIDPIVNPPPPTEFTAHVTLPPLLSRLPVAIGARQFYTSGQPFLGTDLRARAILPSQILTRRQFLQPGRTFEIGGVLNVPKTGGWRPRLVSRLVARSRISFGGGTWLVDPGTLLNAAPCVELHDEQLMNPGFDPETVTNPALVDEALTIPTFGSEELC